MDREDMKEVEDFWHDYLTVIIGSIGVTVFSVITFAIVTRLFSPEQFGSLNLFMLVVQISLFFGANWTANAMTRFGKEEAITAGTVTKTFWARVFMFSITPPCFC